MTDTLLTGRQAAEYMGVSPSVITRLVNDGTLNCTMVGARRAFAQDTLETYLEKHNQRRAAVDHERKDSGIPEIVALSFFTGAGGLDLGMEETGIHSMLYCENNRECRMTIDRNRPNAALIGDINEYDAADVLRMAGIPESHEVDIMFGGPPCQAFSTAGARRAFDDARGNVFLRFLAIAADIRPRYLVIENVRGLLSTPFPIENGGRPVRGGAMRVILNKLHDMGYKVSFNLYNAANFGAAQIRERVVIIAKRNGQAANWLTPTNSNQPSWGLPQWKTFREATENIEPKSHHYIQFPQKRIKYFKMLKAGQYWTSLPKNIQREAMGKALDLGGGKTGFYRRLSWDKPAPTLVTSPIMKATDLCHPEELRPLSIEEYRAIQGFPEDWWIAGELADMYRQIGNAVPIKLGSAIGQTLIDDMNGVKQDRDWSKFPYSRYTHTSDKTWSAD
ncbi:DNA cytosine methyltransferase [Bifidobacterium miconisargentati]|uniref:DNA cytosine methyltransferase n=1 Tax=Bifidobacterium miconisargentati TaxID=2834437 RepID=UPI001BDBE575|nr:DNA cytosine methyltransferase [Bifidobacterium miconisargentati]MBW3090262.1 DNA cytosine methyltransferase [Bifidobacterium miconisargentati]